MQLDNADLDPNDHADDVGHFPAAVRDTNCRSSDQPAFGTPECGAKFVSNTTSNPIAIATSIAFAVSRPIRRTDGVASVTRTQHGTLDVDADGRSDGLPNGPTYGQPNRRPDISPDGQPDAESDSLPHY